MQLGNTVKGYFSRKRGVHKQLDIQILAYMPLLTNITEFSRKQTNIERRYLTLSEIP